MTMMNPGTERRTKRPDKVKAKTKGQSFRPPPKVALERSSSLKPGAPSTAVVPPEAAQAEPSLPAQAAKPLRGAELTARARIEELFDPNTFMEIDAEVHHRARMFGMAERHLPGDGVICGWGQIDGRQAWAYAQDRAVLGGSLGEAHAQKIIKLMDLAGRSGQPLIGINDSGGARIQEGVEALAGYGEIFRRNVELSGVVPQISLLMGPCAGGAVYSPALTDFVIMVAKKSYMFVTGPKVVRAVTSEEIDTETLGGGEVHAARSGVAHFLVDSELEGLALARQILSYFPSNNCEMAPPADNGDPIGRSNLNLQEIVPKEANKPYDVRRVIKEVFDDNSFLEVSSRFCPKHCGGPGAARWPLCWSCGQQPANLGWGFGH